MFDITVWDTRQRLKYESGKPIDISIVNSVARTIIRTFKVSFQGDKLEWRTLSMTCDTEFE